MSTSTFAYTSSLKLDDNDLGQITYSSGWQLMGNPDKEFNGTTHFTSTDRASFLMKFNGTSISVYGTLDSSDAGPNSSYSIDGEQPKMFNAPRVRDQTYNTLFFHIENLQNTEHTLVGECVGEGSRIFLDYLIVGSPLPTPICLDPTTVSITIETTQTSIPSPTLEAPLTVSSPPGPIVGGVLGGASLSLLVGFVIFYIKRRISGMERDRKARPYLQHYSSTFPPLPPLPRTHYRARSANPTSTRNNSTLSAVTPSTGSPGSAVSPPVYMSELGGWSIQAQSNRPSVKDGRLRPMNLGSSTTLA